MLASTEFFPTLLVIQLFGAKIDLEWLLRNVARLGQLINVGGALETVEAAGVLSSRDCHHIIFQHRHGAVRCLMPPGQTVVAAIKRVIADHINFWQVNASLPKHIDERTLHRRIREVIGQAPAGLIGVILLLESDVLFDCELGPLVLVLEVFL